MLYRSDVPASSKWPVDPRNGGHLTLEKVTDETPKCIQMGHLDVLRWGSKSSGLIIHVWHYMFSNKSWSSRPFFFAMGFGDGDLAHTHTHTHTWYTHCDSQVATNTPRRLTYCWWKKFCTSFIHAWWWRIYSINSRTWVWFRWFSSSKGVLCILRFVCR